MRFYSYNPLVYYPWVLRKITNPYVKCSHEIVDIGIYDLLKTGNHDKDKLKLWEECQTSGWKTVPDIPDLTGEFGEEMDYCNVEETFKYLTKYYDPQNDTHLPSIQSKYEDLSSFKNSVDYFEDEWGVPNKCGIGSVCKINNNKIGLEMIKYIREKWPNTYIHAFGLRWNLLKQTYSLINSYDTMAWTLQRCPPDMKPRTANTNNDRVNFFNFYVKKMKELVGDEFEQ